LNRRNTHILLLSFIYFIGVSIHAQVIDDYIFVEGEDEYSKTDVGLRMGFGANTIFGNAMQRQRPSFGFTGAISHRIPFDDRRSPISLYHELGATFQGSRFSHDPQSSYEKMSLVYLEMPIGILYDFVKDYKQTKAFYIGIEPAYLYNATVFAKDAHVASYLSDDIGKGDFQISRFDLRASVGVFFKKGVIGMMPLIKFGLLDINQGINLQKLVPPTNPEGSMRNVHFSFNIIF
jgi:hypothetical protein